jgi:hypothetical protein
MESVGQSEPQIFLEFTQQMAVDLEVISVFVLLSNNVQGFSSSRYAGIITRIMT